MRTLVIARLHGFALIALASVTAGAGVKATSSWSAPDLQPASYAKVAVYAKISDDIARRILEDEVVAGLTKRGIAAVAAYQTFTPADLATEAAIEAKAAELGVDAAIVFHVTGQDTQHKAGPSVHASVGVPVHAGPFSVFLGTSVPLGGGSSTVRTVGAKSEFHAKGHDGPRFIVNYTADLKGGTERAAEEIAEEALRQLKKADVFESKKK